MTPRQAAYLRALACRMYGTDALIKSHADGTLHEVPPAILRWLRYGATEEASVSIQHSQVQSAIEAMRDSVEVNEIALTRLESSATPIDPEPPFSDDTSSNLSEVDQHALNEWYDSHRN